MKRVTRQHASPFDPQHEQEPQQQRGSERKKKKSKSEDEKGPESSPYTEEKLTRIVGEGLVAALKQRLQQQEQPTASGTGTLKKSTASKYREKKDKTEDEKEEGSSPFTDEKLSRLVDEGLLAAKQQRRLQQKARPTAAGIGAPKKATLSKKSDKKTERKPGSSRPYTKDKIFPIILEGQQSQEKEGSRQPQPQDEEGFSRQQQQQQQQQLQQEAVDAGSSPLPVTSEASSRKNAREEASHVMLDEEVEQSSREMDNPRRESSMKAADKIRHITHEANLELIERLGFDPGTSNLDSNSGQEYHPDEHIFPPSRPSTVLPEGEANEISFERREHLEPAPKKRKHLVLTTEQRIRANIKRRERNKKAKGNKYKARENRVKYKASDIESLRLSNIREKAYSQSREAIRSRERFHSLRGPAMAKRNKRGRLECTLLNPPVPEAGPSAPKSAYSFPKPTISFSESVAAGARKTSSLFGPLLATQLQRLAFQAHSRAILEQATTNVRRCHSLRTNPAAELEEDQDADQEGAGPSKKNHPTTNTSTQPRVECVHGNCKSSVSNLPRHYRNVHGVEDLKAVTLTDLTRKIQVNVSLGDGPMPQVQYEAFTSNYKQIVDEAIKELSLAIHNENELNNAKTGILSLAAALEALVVPTDHLSTAQENTVRIDQTRTSVISALGPGSYGASTHRQMADRLLMPPPLVLPPISCEPTPAVPTLPVEAPAPKYYAMVITCAECSKVVMYNKIRNHIHAVHKSQYSTPDKVNALAKRSATSERRVRLSGPVRKGAAIGPLIVETEFTVGKEADQLNLSSLVEVDSLTGLRSCKKSKSIVSKFMASTGEQAYHSDHPNLCRIWKSFNAFLVSRNNLPPGTTMRQTKHLVAITGLYVREVHCGDMTENQLFTKLFDIVEHYRVRIRKMITVATARKHFQVIIDLGAYLHKENHRVQSQLIPGFDSTIFATALKRVLISMANDRPWIQAFESKGDKKERELLPVVKIVEFLKSSFVNATIHGAICYAEIAGISETQNIPVTQMIETLGDRAKKLLLPSFTNAIALRDVLITLAVCDTARRSVELMAFELREFRSPKAIEEDFALFKIANHKTWKTKACYIRLEGPVLLAFCSFITHYRPMITNLNEPDSPVFPAVASSNLASAAHDQQRLSISSIGQITNRTFKKRAKCEFQFRFVPRRIRHSVVTAASNLGASDEELINLAYVMGHVRKTASEHNTVGVVMDKVIKTKNMINLILHKAMLSANLPVSDSPHDMRVAAGVPQPSPECREMLLSSVGFHVKPNVVSLHMTKTTVAQWLSVIET